MKKWFFLFISICILCSFVPATAIAENVDSEVVYFEGENNKITTSVNPRFPSGVSLFSSRLSDEQKAEKLRDFLVERLSNMEQYQDELSLGEYRFPGDFTASDVVFVNLSEFLDFKLLANSSNKASTKEIIATAITDIQNKFPKLFWIKNAYYWEYNLSNYKVTKIGLKLNCNTNFNVNGGLQPVINKVDSLTSKFDNYVQAIVELIPEGYSDYEKILFVNDYLCTNYKYDVDYRSQTLYDFFETGTGVCQGYTLAFMAIMDELDIRCDSVVSEEMNHIWNLVELNEKWYHIDVTWNDPYWENCDTDTLGLAQHKYFLLSSECMQDSDHEHYDFDVESYGYEFGTEFDNVEINLNQSLRTSFIELNGTWYNTGYNTDARTCGLYAFNSPDISLISTSDFKAPLYNIGSWGYIGSFSYLSKYKNIILFNTPDSICGYDGNKISVIYTPEKRSNEKIYGFDIKGDTIRIQFATNPNESGMKKATLKTANLVDLIEQSLTIESYDKTTRKTTIYAPEDTEGILFFASYDEDERLIDCKLMACSGDDKITNGTNEYTAPDGFDTTSAEKVKIMIWKNISAFNPLCGAYEK